MIEFEHYDTGGEGVSYHDTATPDVEPASDAGGGSYLGTTLPG